MIRALRRKFIISAMLALSILLLLLIGGIVAINYLRTEKMTDDMLEAVAYETPPSMPDERENRPAFGYQIPDAVVPSPYFVAGIDDAQNISIQNFGLRGGNAEEAEVIVREALASGLARGKIGTYKYLIVERSGEKRMVFMDNSIRVGMLLNMLQTACGLAFLCLGLMLLILLPVSKRAMRPFAMNMQRQKEFVTNAGHEIKTPVAVIQSNVDAMDLIRGESKWSRNIRGQTARLNALLQQLLLLARSDEANAGLPMDTVALGAMLREEIAAYEEMLRQRELTLRLCADDAVRVFGHDESLRQLLRMLMDNAANYAKPGGVVEIELKQRARKAVLSFYNTVETPPSVRPEALFERFYRGDAARANKGGCGIGLSVARAVAQTHRGKIYAVYEREGVRFIVELPRQSHSK